MDRNHSETGTSEDSVFSAFVTEYQEALAAGTPPPSPERLSPSGRERWEKMRPALLLLARAGGVPDALPAPPGPKDPSTIRSPAHQTQTSSGKMPRQLGRFALIRELGRGGMGIVYLARDPALQRLVALKTITRTGLDDKDQLARFEAEAHLHAQQHHPNIVQVYETGWADRRPFLVMEYVDGMSLSQHLDGRPMEARRAAALLAQVAGAVAHAHQAGIVHRDLKPSNILLDAAGTPRVTDFGLARSLCGSFDLTRTGDLLGTPAYMAPEIVTGSKAGPLVDVYGLGAILYELLTGHAPFVGVDVFFILAQVQHAEPIAPRQINPQVPADLQTICLKCLEKEPARRYAGAAELADDLQRFLEGQPIRARPASFAERAVKWARRNPAISSLLAVILVLVPLSFALVTSQMLRANREWDRAEEKAQAEARARQDAENAQARYLALAGAEKKARHDAEAAGAEVRARAEAEARARERAEWALYGSQLTNAIYLWQDNDLQSTRRLLEGCPERFRHWEFGFLHRLAQSNQTVWDAGLSGGPVERLAVAPDGSRVAVASNQGEIHMLAGDTGKSLWRQRVGKIAPSSVCFSSDSRRGASLLTIGPASEARLCVWDAIDGHTLLTIPVKPEWGTVCFSPDGRRLVYGGGGIVHVLDAADGKELLALPGHPGARVCVACSADGKYIAGTGDRVINIWDAATGELARTLEGNNGAINGLSISPDSKYLAVCNSDPSLRVWDLATGQLRQVCQGHTRFITSLGFSPDSKRLVSGSWDRTVRLWDVAGGRGVRTLRGHEAWVTALAFFPDGRRVISGDWRGRLIVWDADQDQEARALLISPWVRCASLSPDGTRIAAIDGFHTRVWVVDSRTGKEIWVEGLQNARAVKYSPDGQSLMVLATGQPLQRRDAATGKLLHTYADDPAGVIAFALDRKGRQVATIGGDQTLKVRDVLSGRLLIQGEKLPDDFRAGPLCFSHDGRWLFLGSNRGRLHVRDATSGTLCQTLPGHPAPILCMAASADGRYLATGSADRTLKLWDAATGQERTTLRGHPNAVWAVTFSPDGERLISGCYLHTMKVWCTANGQEVLPHLPGHLAAITSLEFSPDGRWLMSSSEDGTVRLWDGGEQAYPRVKKP